jgi:hypothetical protein
MAKEVPVSQHESVGTGDKINTDQTGLGILTFADFLRVEVFRQTGLQVKAAPDPNAPLIVKLYLALGTTLQQLKKRAGQRVDVTTDTDWATIRAVSTTYLISVDDDEVTWVVVSDGEAEVEAQGQTVIVRAGQATWVEPGQPPHSPIDVDSGAVEKWLEKLGGTGEVGPIRPVIQPSEEEDQTDPWLEVGHWPEEPDETQEVTVGAKAGDDETGLDRIEIQMPGQPLVTCRESYCEASGGPYPAGEYSYEVGAFDAAGNVAYREGHFAVDATALPSAARFSLSIGGELFNDEWVQNALGFGIDWGALRDEIGEVVLVDFLSGDVLADSTEPAYDPERARELLAEAGYYGFDAMLLFDRDDEFATSLAELVTDYLYAVEIYPKYLWVASADARTNFADMIAAGESGLLIERR